MSSDEDIDEVLRSWARDSIAVSPLCEHDLPDAHMLVTRPQRQHRPVMMLAAATLVAVVGLVTAALAVRGAEQHSGSVRAGAVRSANSALTAPIPATSRCPKRLPEPGAADPQSDPLQPMFTRAVASMTVCGYDRDAPGGRLVTTVGLRAALATRLARDVNRAPSSEIGSRLQCLTALKFQLLIARDHQGKQLPFVTLTPGCEQVTAYNGFATRILSVNDLALRQAQQFAASVLPRGEFSHEPGH